jgi:glycerol-3-phosphate acyltransferase PlsY
MASYAAGGVPTGYCISRRLKGIDIREHGSGNPGASNVYRVVGARAGLATLAVDALKGCAPAAAARRLFPDNPWAWAFCGAAAIVGHIWTPFLGLKGGKGVATSAGVFAALVPIPAAGAALVFLAGATLSRHISVGSIAAAVALPLFAALSGAPAPVLCLASGAAALILVKHIPNMRRLASGDEPGLRRGGR